MSAKKKLRNPETNGPQPDEPRAISLERSDPRRRKATATQQKPADQDSSPPKQFGSPSSLTKEQREQAIALFKADPEATTGEVADQIGAKYQAINWIKRRYANGVDIAARVTREYEKRFTRKLPVIERVRVYTDIARGEIDAKRAFSALKALQRIEELEGIVTKKEQKEAEHKESSQAPGPVFVIAGAQINVGGPQPVVVEAVSAKVPESQESAGDVTAQDVTGGRAR